MHGPMNVKDIDHIAVKFWSLWRNVFSNDMGF